MSVNVIGPVNEGEARGDQVLVEAGGRHFVVSSVVAPFSGFETLVFPADAEGNITDWCEIAGGRAVSREEAIAELDAMFGDVIEGTATEVRDTRELPPGV